MTNCEDIEDKSSQEYKDCLEKNKPIETEKIDQTAEQFEKDKIEKDRLAMLEIINKIFDKKNKIVNIKEKMKNL